MPGTTVTLIPGTLPSPYCPASYQQLNVDIVSRVVASIATGVAGINYGDSTPSAENRDKPWYRTIGGVPDRIYVYYNGAWVALHPVPPGNLDGFVAMWQGTLAALITFDGGNAGAPGPASGPFWEEVPEMRARFPLGPGTLPSGTVVAHGAVGGEETHVLTVAELATHKHTISSEKDAAGGGAGHYMDQLNQTGFTPSDLTQATTDTGSNTAHNNMPPYYGIYCIRRTSRYLYVV